MKSIRRVWSKVSLTVRSKSPTTFTAWRMFQRVALRCRSIRLTQRKTETRRERRRRTGMRKKGIKDLWGRLEATATCFFIAVIIIMFKIFAYVTIVIIILGNNGNCKLHFVAMTIIKFMIISIFTVTTIILGNNGSCKLYFIATTIITLVYTCPCVVCVIVTTFIIIIIITII